MVCEKPSMLRLLMLACLGVLLLASSCKSLDDDGAGFTDFGADHPASFQTTEPEDIFAKKVADLPEELQEFVNLNEETISVKLPKSHGERIVLPLLAAKNELVFNVSQEETCLEEEQKWQFNYPAENCNSSIKWNKMSEDGRKFIVLHLLDSSIDIYGTNFMRVYLNVQKVSISDASVEDNIVAKKFGAYPVPLFCALNASRYDTGPYGSYFNMDFWIENVPSGDADKSGKCDITLKFKAADFKFPTTTTTEEPITESIAENTESPDDAIHSTPSGEDEHTDESSGSNLIWIIVGPIIGLCSILTLLGVLLWYFKFRGGSDDDDGSTKLEAVVSSAAPTTPTAATSVPFQATEMTAKEAYGSKRGEIKQSKPEKKPDKKSPKGKKDLGNKKGKGVNK